MVRAWFVPALLVVFLAPTVQIQSPPSESLNVACASPKTPSGVCRMSGGSQRVVSATTR